MICNEESEIVNMEVNVQLVNFLSGKKVDINKVEHAKEVLIRCNDSRMFKAALILRCLFEDTSTLKYNTELLLNLFFAVAIADSGADNLELDMMKRMIDPKRVDAFHAEVMTLSEVYAGKFKALVKVLTDRSVELTKSNNYTIDEIKHILHHVIFVVLADLRILQSEKNILFEYGRQVGLSTDDINLLFTEFL